MRSALLVVDIQNDFCPGGALAVPGGDRVVPVANILLEKIPLSVLTQDWHPLGHTSFASSSGKPPYTIDDSVTPPRVLWPDHCVAGTWGADFHPGLNTNRSRLILRKGANPLLDSYSAFFENDGLSTTGLAGWLSSFGIDSIILVGLATDYCVKASALDARRLGLKVDIVSEGIRGVDASTGDMEKAVEAMKKAGCRIVALKEIFR